MKIEKNIFLYAVLLVLVSSVSFSVYKNQGKQAVLDYLGASVVSTYGSSSSSSNNNPCSNGKPCCAGIPYSGSERCCNGVIYDTSSWQGTNPDGSISSHNRVCCNGKVEVIGNNSRWTGTLCCQNTNRITSYNRFHWDCSSTGVCSLNEKKVCGGCANEPTPPMADYCVQLRDAYIVHTPWNTQRCSYDNPQWRSCGIGSSCNKERTGCKVNTTSKINPFVW